MKQDVVYLVEIVLSATVVMARVLKMRLKNWVADYVIAMIMIGVRGVRFATNNVPVMRLKWSQK